jgi:hypothetical protein
MTFTNTLQYASDLNSAFNVVTSDMNTKVIKPSVNYAAFPIGTMLFWAKSLSGVPGTLPSGWQECDGTNGTPNLLNTTDSTMKFFRGTTSTTGTTGGSDSHSHGVSGYSSDYYAGSGGDTPNISSGYHLPSSYKIVPIIKVS